MYYSDPSGYWKNSRPAPPREADHPAAGRTITGLPASWQGIRSARDHGLNSAAGDEDRLKSILDSVPQILWSVRPDARLYLNRQWHEFTGAASDGIDSVENWLSFIHADDRERLMLSLKDSLLAGKFAGECRLRHRSGEYRWVLIQGAESSDRDGTVCWYGTCIDIHQRVLAEEALRATERRFQHTLDLIPQMVWTKCPDGSHSYYNKQWYDFIGDPFGDDGGIRRAEVVHPDDFEAAESAWSHSLATGEIFEHEYRMRNASGEYIWVRSRAIPERDANGDVMGWYGTTTDVHQRVLDQEALQVSEGLNRSIVQASADCIDMLDLDGNILFSNSSTLEELAVPELAAVIGKPWVCTFLQDSRLAARNAIASALKNGTGHFTALRPTSAGVPKWWDVVVTPVRHADGRAASLVAISRDVTHQKIAEEQVHWAALHDPLTELPNRSFFQNALDQALARAAQSGTRIGLLLVDLDDFKQINDTLGHEAGDRLLCACVERLRAAVGPGDVVARLGGDEFAIVLNDVAVDQDIIDAARKILTELKRPHLYDGRVLDCRATIGASVYPEHGEHRTELLKQADVALYVAKAGGRGSMRLFEPAMRAEMKNRASMLSLARKALDHERIEPFYQPKMDFRTGRPVGFEALLRWRHHDRGVQLPGTIAAAFEDAELACAISDRIIDGVIAQMRNWLDAGVDFGHVAVNASAAEFQGGDFADRLLERLHRAMVPARSLQLEVTETVFLGRGAEYVDQALKQLSAAGVEIALDDFGTGYASLSHLKQFPVDVIKIDRSFVKGMEDDPDTAAIVRAVVNLGQSLNISIVAEGVESEAQHRLLLAYGCDYGQGYLYGKAAPAADVPGLLFRLPRSREGRE